VKTSISPSFAYAGAMTAVRVFAVAAVAAAMLGPARAARARGSLLRSSDFVTAIRIDAGGSALVGRDGRTPVLEGLGQFGVGACAFAGPTMSTSAPGCHRGGGRCPMGGARRARAEAAETRLFGAARLLK
jgi:hypothetical protein